MIDTENFLLFVGLSWVLIVTPGPDLIYVLTRGIASGRKAGLVSAVGVTLGILVHTIFAALGLSLILQTSAEAFLMVKLIGAGYLVYLGVKTLMSKQELTLGSEQQSSTRKIFWQGLVSNTLNPKVALFFIAFLPQFIQTNGTEISPLPFLILGSVFACFTLIFLAILGHFSGAVGHYLKTRAIVSKWIQYVSGLVMILLGIRLALTKK